MIDNQAYLPYFSILTTKPAIWQKEFKYPENKLLCISDIVSGCFKDMIECGSLDFFITQVVSRPSLLPAPFPHSLQMLVLFLNGVISKLLMEM